MHTCKAREETHRLLLLLLQKILGAAEELALQHRAGSGDFKERALNAPAGALGQGPQQPRHNGGLHRARLLLVSRPTLLLA